MECACGKTAVIVALVDLQHTPLCHSCFKELVTYKKDSDKMIAPQTKLAW